MEKPSVVIAEVEDFIKSFSNGDLVLAPEAKDMMWIGIIGENFLGRPKRAKRNLPDIIGYAIATYQLHKDSSPWQRLEKAYDLLDLIQRARAYGLIRNPKQQTIHYEQEIEELKQQLASLRELNTKLTLENKRLHNLLGDVGKSELGDVK